MFKQNFLYFNLCLLPCHWAPLRRVWHHIIYTCAHTSSWATFFRLNSSSSVILFSY